MSLVRDVVVCMACGALILGVPFGVYLLGRIAAAVESMRAIEEQRFDAERSRW